MCYFESSRGGLLGRGEFVLPVLRALAAEHNRPLVITTEHGERPAHWVIVTRVKHYAANLTLAEDADLNRQCLHVIRFTGTGPLVRTRQLAALMLGLVRHDPGVEIEAATRILIDGHKTTPVQIDGEAKGYLPLRIGIHPKRLSLIFPARPV